MSWWALAAPVATIAIVLWLPGGAILRAAGVRGFLAWGAAPAVSAAYLGLAGFVLDRAGIAWGWVPLAVGLVPLVGVAAACGGWVRRAARARDLAPGGLWSRLGSFAPWDRRRSLLFAGAAGFAALTILVPLGVGLGAPDAIIQQWDAVYHQSGVQLVRDSGNASLLGAMQGQYGSAAAGVFYPVVWHGVVALAPGSVALAANASLAVIGAGVWLTGLAALGRVLGERAWHLAPWTVILGAAFGLFPHRIMIEVGYWPLATSIALIPGLLALVVAASRTNPGELGLVSVARRAVTVLVLLTAMAGVSFAHPAGGFSLLLVVVPVAIVRLVLGVRYWWRAGRRRAAVATAVVFGVAFAGGLALVLGSPTARNVANYTYDVNDFFLVTVYRTLFDLPTAPAFPGLWPLAVLTVVGAVVVLRRAELAHVRWLVWSGVAVLVVAMAAAGGLGPLRFLGGPWYSQTARIVAVFPLVAAPLAAFGLLALVERLRRTTIPADGAPGRRSRVAVRLARVPAGRLGLLIVAIACLATLGWYAPQKAARTAEFVAPGPVRWGTMLSVEEIALLERLSETTPPDAVILGDPANGAALAFSVAQRSVVFPQLGASDQSPDQRTLRFGFHELMRTPAICEAVNALGVTHFYQDTATVEDGAKVSVDWPGLTTPVTPEMLTGLEVVDSAGTATLYRVTACQP